MRNAGFNLMMGIAALLCLSIVAGATDKQTILYSFTGGVDGSGPASGLIADASGNLYGTAAGGGTNNNGTVFELSPNSSGGWTETVLYSFVGGDAGDGSEPMGIVFDGRGNIFGLTQAGGTSDSICGCGAVFELSPNSNGAWTETVLYRFTSESGRNPLGAPSLDAAGNLYGTTPYGGTNDLGVVFQLSPVANDEWTERTIFNFSKTSGRIPFTGVILDSAGNLYGVTQGGGGPDGRGEGTVYKLSKVPWGWSFSLLYTFRGSGGASPLGSLVFDSAGNLYGTTTEGGTTSYGTVFELTPTARGQWKKTLLHNFTGGSDGGNPWAGLTIDPAGNLYGIAAFTATNTVFKLSPSARGGWVFEVLDDLISSEDYVNLAPFLLDSAGNLYNVTSVGGGGSCSVGCGFVYELSPAK